jgi:hypothetical protein
VGLKFGQCVTADAEEVALDWGIDVEAFVGGVNRCAAYAYELG